MLWLAGSSARGAGYTMPISFSGYSGRSETLTNFPVLVVLSNNVGGSGLNFASQPFLSTNGWDLRFRDALDTTNLNYEVESWSTNGPCYVWVQVPRLTGDGTASVSARWGDSADSNQLACTTNGATWDGNYRAIWHLNGIKDATAYKNNGTDNGTDPASGRVGNGRLWNAAGDYITVPDSPSVSVTGDITLEAWVNATSFSGGNNIFAKDGNNAYRWRVQDTGGTFWCLLSDGAYDLPSVSYAFATNRWYHLAIRAELGSVKKVYFYVNGAQVGSPYTTTKASIADTTGSLVLGCYNAGSEAWSGVLDELRITGGQRSSNWLWACYMNQGSNLAFNTYGTAAAPGTPVISNGVGATNVQATTAWLNGVLVSTGTSQAAWGVVWGTNNPGLTRDGWLGGGATELGAADSANLTNTTLATGLAVNQTYYYTYWATNAAGTNVAAARSFTTSGPPSVDIASGATNIGVGVATLAGYLSSTGSLPTEVYVYWGPSTNAWANTNSLGFRGVGAFSLNLSNLLYGVRYYYQCYAVNSYAGQWTATTNFMTLVPTGQGTWAAGWGKAPWTGDADSGVSSAYNYLVAVNMGSGDPNPTVTINGVTFAAHAASGANYSIVDYITPLSTSRGLAGYIGGESRKLAEYFYYASVAPNVHVVAITNLTVGARYLFTLYSYGWEATGRMTTFATSGSSQNFDQDAYGNSMGIRIFYAFEATAPGQVFYTTNNSFHMSGLSVAQDPIPKATLGVTNTGATAVTPGSATFGGLVQATASVFDVWAYWGPADGTNNPAAWGSSNLVATVTNVTSASVSKTISGLSAGTVYYTYRMGNAATNFWASPSGSAVVLSTSDMPTIHTQPESGVNTNVATLNGLLTSTGASATAVSVYWGPGSDQIVTGAWAFTNDFGTCAYLPPEGAAYATNVTGLIPGQLYTYRYYAVNATTGFWGDARSFTTWITPTVDNGGGATAVSATNATLRGSVLGGNPSPQAWIYWGTADGGANRGGWDRPASVLGVQAGAFATNVYGLLANTQYWYRCYVSNACGEGWAAASTNFATGAPVLSIGNASVNEGAQGTFTTAVVTVTLSATSAAPVSVSYATANGANAVAGTDYHATNGTLTLPAGVVSGQLQVTAIGNDLFEASKTVAVNLTSPVNATLGNTQGVVTIANDDWNIFVRGDGLGSDTNSGATWNRAFATLQKALDTVPYYTPLTVNVQASTGSQSYATCTRALYANPSTYRPFGASFIGGWQNVDTTPVLSGVSLVKSALTNKPGFQLLGPYSYHSEPKTLTFDRFIFSNVTHGIEFYVPNGADGSGVVLTLSNTAIYAVSNGICIDYQKPYPTTGAGGPARLTAVNVDIAAGLGGSGDGIRILGAWQGSSVSAAGVDPATGAPRVSTIASAGGHGVYFSGMNNEVKNALFVRTVVYGCAGSGIHLDAALAGYQGVRPYVVQATLANCTIAGNSTNGLDMLSQTAPSWASITNSIFAGNGGHGAYLDSTNAAFACTEGYNVFFDDDIYTNGAARSLAASSSGADPLFYGQGAKPSPWYLLRSAVSPAYRRGSDGLNRGAYQNDRIAGGTAMFFR
jgi:hypothetical protein